MSSSYALDELFNSVFSMFGSDVEYPIYVTNYVKTDYDDIIESDVPMNHYITEKSDEVFEFALAGVSKDLISVKREGRKVIVTVKGKESKEEIAYLDKGIKLPKTKDFTVAKISVTDKFNYDKLDVTYKDGLLKISIPLKEEEKPIDIKIN